MSNNDKPAATTTRYSPIIDNTLDGKFGELTPHAEKAIKMFSDSIETLGQYYERPDVIETKEAVTSGLESARELYDMLSRSVMQELEDGQLDTAGQAQKLNLLISASKQLCAAQKELDTFSAIQAPAPGEMTKLLALGLTTALRSTSYKSSAKEEDEDLSHGAFDLEPTPTSPSSHNLVAVSSVIPPKETE